MPDFSRDDVRILARGAGVPIADADLDEVALRLSVTLTALERIPDTGLDAFDPSPIPAEA